MLKRLWCYCDKIFKLSDNLSKLKSQGFSKKNNETFLTTILLIGMFMRLRSFNTLEQVMKRNAKIWKKILNCNHLPSIDLISKRIENSDIEGIRKFVRITNYKLRRNKSFNTNEASNGLMVAAIDGHETFCSELRCCPKCLTRRKKVNGKTVIEYYHKYVVCQLILCYIPVIIDIEPLSPHRGELTASKRLIKRILKEQPRFIDVFCFDALYLDSKLLNMLDDAKKFWIAVLKQENREAYQEIDRLLPTIKPIKTKINKADVTLWNLENLVGWDNLKKSFRAVVSKEIKAKWKLNRKRKKVKELITHNWRWLTNMPSVYSAEIIHKFGHARWNVENRGFNDLVNNCHFDHPFHHHPDALLAMLWIISIAFNLSFAFFNRNLKPQLKDKSIGNRSQLALTIIETFILLKGTVINFVPP